MLMAQRIDIYDENIHIIANNYDAVDCSGLTQLVRTTHSLAGHLGTHPPENTADKDSRENLDEPISRLVRKKLGEQGIEWRFIHFLRQCFHYIALTNLNGNSSIVNFGCIFFKGTICYSSFIRITLTDGSNRKIVVEISFRFKHQW